MQVAMYLRKSRADLEAEAHGEGETLLRHERILLELAQRRQLSLVKTYREIVSGETISSRPMMQQLLKDVESGLLEGVLVMEVERLARGDTIDQGIVAQTFKYSHTEIITPNKTYRPDDEFDEEYFEFGLFMSRREYKSITRRMQNGRAASVQEGKFAGNRPPYGYIRKKLKGQKGFTLEPHPEQSDIVQLIYHWAAWGEESKQDGGRPLGPSAIAKKLTVLQVPTATGQSCWNPGTVSGILRNPVYLGKVTWRGRPQVKKMIDGQIIKSRPRADPEHLLSADGLHPALIDPDTWERVQGYTRRPVSAPLNKGDTLKNPLAGLITCGFCGHKLVRRPFPDGRPEQLICPYSYCKNISSRLALVEETVVGAVSRWIQEQGLMICPESLVSETPVFPSVQKSIQLLQRKKGTLQRQMKTAYSLLEQGVYSTEIFSNRLHEIETQLSETDQALQQEEEAMNQSPSDGTIPNLTAPLLECFADLYWKGSADERNRLLKQLLDRVVYCKEEGGLGKEQQFSLFLFPKLL